ncbi:MAG: endolytic transglycosylase MltG [Desulfobacterales bacterium]|nr:endolytic transglycosylase MltG [Desulfobacterales bacterium]
MKKKLLLILILFLAATSVAAGLFARHMARYAQTPVNPSLDRPVELVIKPGQSFKDVTAMLREKGLIKHPSKFRILAIYQKATTRIKAGEYRIPGGMSPNQIIQQLGEGRVHLHRVTLPEGLTIHETAQRVADAGLCEKSEFTRAATDPELAGQMGLSAKTTEGYLFPETYYFEKPVSAATIVRTMVSRFHSVFSDQWKQRADKLGFSVHEIVTLASIIEKETGAPEERKTVSSVFHNRLERGMRLDSDPTVIYGIEDFDGNLTRKHLRTPTAYNTYTRRGLPPGPIANPGQASLHAALYPAETPYLYFVADSENSHYFSTTLKEHNRAVRKYQLNR